MWSKNTNKWMLALLALLIIVVPMLSFWYFYKTDDDIFEPYFNAYNEASEKLATSLFSGSKEVIDQIQDPSIWDDTNVSYYQDNQTGEIDYGITFQAIPLEIDFPNILNDRDGVYLVAKYTSYGNTRYNINPKRINGQYSSFDKDEVYWMSPTTLFYSGYTVFLSNYPFGTSTVYSFSSSFPSVSIDLVDTMYNYDLVYNTSEYSNVYTRGFKDYLIYEDYLSAFLLGDPSSVVKWQTPMKLLVKNYDWSNYNNLPNVLLLENPNDVNDLYIVDLTNSNEPVYYRTIEDYENSINSESIHIEDVYDYMEIFGIHDLMLSIVNYLKSFPRAVIAMMGLQNLIEEILLSENLAKYIFDKIEAKAKDKIEESISDLKDKITDKLITIFNSLSSEQQQLILELIDNVVTNHPGISNFISDKINQWLSDNSSALESNGIQFILDKINEYQENHFNEIINNINNTVRGATIQYVNMLQNEYSDAKANVSLIETQQKIYEKIILKSMIETIPSQYLEDIINNPEFELSVEIRDDIIYFYTNKDKDEYFGYDLYSQTIFTPEVKGMNKH